MNHFNFDLNVTSHKLKDDLKHLNALDADKFDSIVVTFKTTEIYKNIFTTVDIVFTALVELLNKRPDDQGVNNSMFVTSELLDYITTILTEWVDLFLIYLILVLPPSEDMYNEIVSGDDEDGYEEAFSLSIEEEIWNISRLLMDDILLHFTLTPFVFEDSSVEYENLEISIIEIFQTISHKFYTYNFIIPIIEIINSFNITPSNIYTAIPFKKSIMNKRRDSSIENILVVFNKKEK